MLMNVCLGCTTVTGMLPVITLMEALIVCVMKGTMEMENYAYLLVRLNCMSLAAFVSLTISLQ